MIIRNIRTFRSDTLPTYSKYTVVIESVGGIKMNKYFSKAIMAFFTIVIATIIIAFIVSSSFRGDTTETTESTSKTEGVVTKLLTDEIENQEEVEQAYVEELESGKYTEDNMLVIQDPYGNSPLTALVLFKTEEPSKVTVEVPGRTKKTTITHTYEEYKTTHEIPVLGLLANTTNKVTVTVENENGNVTKKTLSMKTEKLPNYIGNINVEKANTEKMELGNSSLTFFVPSTKYPYAYDTYGDVRWYNIRYNSHVFQELENGHILYLTKADNSDDTYNELVEMDYLGKYYKIYELNSDNAINEGKSEEMTMVHHDAIELPSGNLLLTVNGDTNYIEDIMIELDRETGEIVKTIDLKDLLPSEFYEEYDETTRDDGKVDWFHQNAVVFDESDNSIIISSRNQDLIMKVDYKTSRIIWIMADEEGWPDDYKQYLVAGTGDSFKYTAGQHAPVILPDQDNNEDTIDLLVYDNNVVVTRGNESLSKEYSRGVQYRINEKKRTSKEIWSFGEELGADHFTNIVGSTRFLPQTGNRLVNFGYLDEDTHSAIFEVSENGEVVFEANITDFPAGARAYRSERYSLYNNNWEYSL